MRRIGLAIVGIPAVVVAIIVVYVLAGITKATFAEWSVKVEAAVTAAVAVVLWVGHRIVTRDRAVRDLERIPSAARPASDGPTRPRRGAGERFRPGRTRPPERRAPARREVGCS